MPVHRAAKLEHQTYNIGSGRATSNGESLGAVKKVKPFADVAIQESKSPRFKLNNYSHLSRIGAELGYEPR